MAAAVYQAVNAPHGTMPSVNDRWRFNMTQNKPAPHAAKRLATAMMLLSLLGTAGCMTWHRPVTSTPTDVQNVIDPTIDLAGQSTDECKGSVSCEPPG